jgi:hypothetical protein
MSKLLGLLTATWSILMLSSVAYAEKIPSGHRASTASTAQYRGKPLVQGTLIVDVAKATPGIPFYAGVRLKMAPGWHIYWRNPGDAGLPTRLRWSTGKGVAIGKTAWPAPMVKRDASGEITTYEYGNETLLAVRVVAKVRRGRPDITLTAKVKLLACNKVCIPGDLSLTRQVPVDEVVRPLPSQDRWIFQRFHSHVPRPVGQLGYGQRWTMLPPNTSDEGRVRVQAEFTCKGSEPCPGIQAPTSGRKRDAFMLQKGDIESVQVERILPVNSGRRFIVILSAAMEPEKRSQDLPIKGVLTLSGKGGQPLLLEVAGTARRIKDDMPPG